MLPRTTTVSPRPRITLLALGLLFGAVMGSIHPAVAQDDVKARKMERQVGVLEKILDQVLIDSPNFLVPGRNNTRGIFLDEFGVLLTYEASLVDKDKFDWNFDFDRKPQITKDEDGNQVIVIPKRDDSEERTPIRRGEARLYERGKVEIREMLLDYGDTMTGLSDNHWLAVAAYLKDSDYFIDERISRLVMKVKMKDLRAYTAGKIDEETVLSRFVEDEY
ncbi:MAG: hypothetical protein R3E97_16375 [Candidatus Eisenbacteria bacterium]